MEFKGFHPKDVNSAVTLKLKESGIEYYNLENTSFQFIAYQQLAGYSGWQPGYGSLHLYSANANLSIHVNFPEDSAHETISKIIGIIQEKLA
ncbi:MAG: hypothetical protein F6K00_08260 [Leptolyngbya sp. SIOISBB]|nr:hypothetical protein [Leptolyngbya sp. SIOISBB]